MTLTKKSFKDQEDDVTGKKLSHHKIMEATRKCKGKHENSIKLCKQG